MSMTHSKILDNSQTEIYTLSIPRLPRFPQFAHDRWVTSLVKDTSESLQSIPSGAPSFPSSPTEQPENVRLVDICNEMQDSLPNWDDLSQEAIKQCLSNPSDIQMFIPQSYVSDNNSDHYSCVYEHLYCHRHSLNTSSLVINPSYLYACLKLCLIGVSSDLIHWDCEIFRFVQLQCMRLSTSNEIALASLIENITEIGTMFRRIELISDGFRLAGNRSGAVLASLRSCLKGYLQYFRSVIKNVYPDRMPENFSLLNFDFLVRRFALQIQFLAKILKCDKDFDLEQALMSFPRGFRLLKYLFGFLRVTHGDTHALVTQILTCCLIPYVKFLENWAYFGKLTDPMTEFGLSINYEVEHSKDEKYWTQGMVLETDIVESDDRCGLLTRLLLTTVECGKGVKFLSKLNPGHYLCTNDLVVPKLNVYFDINDVESHCKELDMYVEQTEKKRVFLKELKYEAVQNEKRKEIELRKKLHLGLQKVEEEINQAHEERRKILQIKKQSLLEELRESAEKSKQRKIEAKVRERLKEERFVNGSILDFAVPYDKLKEQMMKEIEMEYAELEKAAEKKALLSEWKLRRFRLAAKRKSYFESKVEEVGQIPIVVDMKDWDEQVQKDASMTTFSRVQLENRDTVCASHEMLDSPLEAAPRAPVANDDSNLICDFKEDENLDNTFDTAEELVKELSSSLAQPENQDKMEDERSNEFRVVEPENVEITDAEHSDDSITYTPETGMRDEQNFESFIKEISSELDGINFLSRKMKDGAVKGMSKKKNGSKRVSFEQAIERCVLKGMRNQLFLVNCALNDFFMVDLDIFSHFESLHLYLLMGAGDFCDVLCAKLCSLLESKMTLSHVFSPVLLNEILSSSLELSNKNRDENSKRLSISIKRDSAQSDMRKTDFFALDPVVLDYSVEWPLNLVITKSAMSSYHSIFSFLVRLKRSAWIVKDIRAFTEDCKFRKVARVLDATTVVRMRHLQMFRHEIQHFVSATNDYVFKQIMLIWLKFADTLKLKVGILL